MEIKNQDRIDFRWFGFQKIKDLEIQKNNAKFILSFTFAPFAPFYTLIRTGWDFLMLRYLLLVIFYFSFFTKIMISIMGGQEVKTSESFSITILKIMLPVVLLFSILYIGLCIFECFFHRRLSWNRCAWKDYESFYHSEKNWNKAGIIFFALYVLLILTGSLITIRYF